MDRERSVLLHVKCSTATHFPSLRANNESYVNEVYAWPCIYHIFIHSSFSTIQVIFSVNIWQCCSSACPAELQLKIVCRFVTEGVCAVKNHFVDLSIVRDA